ncbi:hypothetical protein JCM11251_004799 [Rhodosporidiobolus azoricus]
MATELKKDSQSPSAARVDSLLLDKSARATDKVDRFSQLPPELLRAIFRLAYADGRGPRGPLSRFLCVFHTEIVYSAVYVDCNRCLKRFMAKVKKQSELAQLVKWLKISTQDEADEGEEQPPPSPTFKALTTFFASLSSLKTLSLIGAPRLVSLVLQVKFAKKNLQNMHTLTLHSPLEGRLFPFNPLHFAALAEYSTLEEFTLNVDPRPDPFLPTMILMPRTLCSHFSRLTKLALHGSHLDAACAQAILHACDKLKELSLGDQSGDASLVALLEALPSTASLRELELLSLAHPGAVELEDLVPFLKRVNHLRSLTLAGDFALTSSFFTAIRSIHLHILVIGPGTPLSPTLLLDELHPSALPSTLGQLHLSHIFAVRGTTTDLDDPEDLYFDQDTGEAILPPGWIPPNWDEDQGWTPEAIEEVREAAAQGDLDVDGMAFEAEEIEEAFLMEVSKLDAYNEDLAESAARDLEALAQIEDAGSWTDVDEDVEAGFTGEEAEMMDT